MTELYFLTLTPCWKMLPARLEPQHRPVDPWSFAVSGPVICNVP